MKDKARLILAAGLLGLGACDKSAQAVPSSGGHFQVAAEVKGQGNQRTLLLTLRAFNDFKVNGEYPLRFLPEKAQTEVLFAKSEYKLEEVKNTPCSQKPDAVCRVEAEVPIEVTEQAREVSGMLRLSVCSADKCLIEKVPVTAKIPQG